MGSRRSLGARGTVVVKALRYKTEGRGFDNRRGERIFSIYRLCGLVVRVLGYKSGGPGSIPRTTRKKSSGPGTGSTQPREYN
jgi:hypothetical protein